MRALSAALNQSAANQDNGSDIQIEHCVSSKFHTYPLLTQH